MSVPTAPAVSPSPLSLTGQLQRTHAFRVQKAMLQTQFKRATEKFEAEHSELLASIRSLTERVQQEEEQARTLALAAFGAAGEKDKHPAPGVTIKLMRELPDYPTEQAMAWALEHKTALKLDTKAFEAMALAAAVPLLPGLVGRPVPHAQLATDLGAALMEAGTPTEEMPHD